MKPRTPIQTSYAVRWRTLRERYLPPTTFALALATLVLLWRSHGSQGNAIGIVEGTRSLVTSAQAGVLEEVVVRPFQFVEAGQTLATIRPLDLRSQLDRVQLELQMALAESQPSLAQDNAMGYERIRLELLRTQAELAAARVNLLRAANEERRSRPLYQEKLVSEDAYDLAVHTRDLHAAEVLAKSNAIVEIQHRLDSLRSLGEPTHSPDRQDTSGLRDRLESFRTQLDTHLAPSTLRAPISGMVTAVHRQPGEQVAEGEPLITLGSPEPDRIVGYLRQPYTVRLGVGQRVRISTREFPPTSFWSDIVQIGAQVEPITNAAAILRTGQLLDSALPFVVQVPADATVRPGELVDLLLDEAPDAPTLPGRPRSTPDDPWPSGTQHPEEGVVVTYAGMCDASAAVSLTEDRFVVADDEESVLRVYSRRRGGPALQQLDLTAFLGRGRGGKEADLEGSARVGDCVYWVSSHGRSAQGKEQTSRYRFFATRVALQADRVSLQPEGRAYTRLLEDLLEAPQLAHFNLAHAASLAPKAPGGLNIEGLCPGPDDSLLLGFRNPTPEGKALVVPLLNPADLPHGGRAVLGTPRLLDLQGLGIRSLESHGGNYFIAAGSFKSEGPSRLFVWDGTNLPPTPVEVPGLQSLNAEAITFFEWEGAPWMQVLSDDGALKVDGVEAKRLKDATQRTFRGVAFRAPVGAAAGTEATSSAPVLTEKESEDTQGSLTRQSDVEREQPRENAIAVSQPHP